MAFFSLPPLCLVLGGAGSGKSDFAESLVTQASGPWHYLATAQAWDDEMREKISRHRQRRGSGWTTREAHDDLEAALAEARDGVVLLDCLTLWLTGRLLAGDDLEAAQDRLLAALGAAKVPVVVVSNEVGAGGVPENALARRFQTAQGRLNQAVAAQAGLVVAVMAGLPLVLKGRLPA